MMVAVSVPSWRRSARPTACTMSITDVFGAANSTESMAGTSTPSPRQRALATTDQPPSGGCRSRSSTISRWALLISPWTNLATTGPPGRCPSGSSPTVAGKVVANWRAWAIRGTNARARRSPNCAAVIARAAWAAAIATGTPPSPTRPGLPSSSWRTWLSAIAAITIR